jgi:ribosomal protein L30/L7E
MTKIDHLFLTLYRGFAGKGKYQKVLKHFGLTKTGTTVRVPSTFENRAAAKKVRIVLFSLIIPLSLITSTTPLQRWTVDCTRGGEECSGHHPAGCYRMYAYVENVLRCNLFLSGSTWSN